MRTQSMRYKIMKINNNFMLKQDRKMLVAFFGPLKTHRKFRITCKLTNIDINKMNILEKNKHYLNMKNKNHHSNL